MEQRLRKSEIESILDMGVIEQAQTECASYKVFAPKKGRKLRFCVEYRSLNSFTIRDSRMIPRMDEYNDFLGDAEIFTTSDAKRGY